LRKITLYYLYSFLLIDLFNGFILQYLKIPLPISPGQMIRSIFLILAIYDLIRTNKFSGVNRYIFTLIFLLPMYLCLYIVRDGSYDFIHIEIIEYVKPLFFLVILDIICKHNHYFRKKMSIIMLINLVIYSFSIIGSSISGFGIITYQAYGYYATKSFFYANNTTAIMSLILSIYYSYQLIDKKSSIIPLSFAIVAMFLSGTKTIIFIPFIFVYILTFKVIKKKMLKWIMVPTSIILIILGILSIKNATYFVNNNIFNKYESRVYHSVNLPSIERDEITNPLLKYYSYISGGRALRANRGLMNLYNEPENIFFGYGFSMLSEKVGYNYASKTGSEMDAIDLLLRYGIIGSICIYMPIITIIISLVRRRKTDMISMPIYIIFLYSTFAGHIITAPMGASVFALFLGLAYNIPSRKRLYTENKMQLIM